MNFTTFLSSASTTCFSTRLSILFFDDSLAEFLTALCAIRNKPPAMVDTTKSEVFTHKLACGLVT